MFSRWWLLGVLLLQTFGRGMFVGAYWQLPLGTQLLNPRLETSAVKGLFVASSRLQIEGKHRPAPERSSSSRRGAIPSASSTKPRTQKAKNANRLIVTRGDHGAITAYFLRVRQQQNLADAEPS